MYMIIFNLLIVSTFSQQSSISSDPYSPALSNPFSGSSSNHFAEYIFCPESYGDDVGYKGYPDVGLNIFARVETEEGPQLDLKPDCYLRYSTLLKSSIPTISTDFIDPKANTVVFSHGWQPQELFHVYKTHTIPDQWNKIVSGEAPLLEGYFEECNGEKVNPPHPDKKWEECPPDDHDAQYWVKQGWNVIMIDWKQFAGQLWVQWAESKLYNPVYKGKTVVELLYDQLTEVLDMTGWDGDELRFAGHSLGSQVVLNLGGKWRSESRLKYKLKRIALLDHYFSDLAHPYISDCPPSRSRTIRFPWSQQRWTLCEYSTAEYVAEFVLPKLINPADGDPVVIENYKTSWLSKIPIAASRFVELNEKTVLVYLKPWYYSLDPRKGPIELLHAVQKHAVAFAGYLHCMKWYDLMDEYPKRNDYPSCRMETEELREICDLRNKDKCDTFFEQTVEDEFENLSVYTTWDFDDAFEERSMFYERLPPFTEYIPGITEEMFQSPLADYWKVGQHIAAPVVDAVDTVTSL